MRSSRSLSLCDWASIGRHSRITIRPVAKARRLGISCLRELCGVKKQRDYTLENSVDEPPGRPGSAPIRCCSCPGVSEQLEGQRSWSRRDKMFIDNAPNIIGKLL